jgi:hypothetical protein
MIVVIVVLVNRSKMWWTSLGGTGRIPSDENGRT